LLAQAILEIPKTREAEELGVFVGRAETAWVRSDPPHSWLSGE
jgi:hypothetical protein